MECGERRESGECYIPGNVFKHSGKRRQTSWGMLPNIPGNDAKHSGECCQTFGGMSDFIVNLYKDKISLLEQQVIEQKCNN